MAVTDIRRKPSGQFVSRYDWSATREQLMKKPGLWGLVFEPDTDEEANAALKAWHNHRRYGFTAVIRKVASNKWQVWAVYQPTPQSETMPEYWAPPKIRQWAKSAPEPRRGNRNKKGNT